jgi:serine phosphatase RsbU (regulator of sigma subunit)
MLPDLDFAPQSETIAPGESLILYTDGVTDAHDRDGARFSRRHLLDVVAQPAASAQAMVTRIRDAVQAHARDTPQFDDITLLVAHRAG